jgi:hypothetical protein
MRRLNSCNSISLGGTSSEQRTGCQFSAWHQSANKREVKISAKRERAYLLDAASNWQSRDINTLYIITGEGMSVFASKRGCQIWHRRLQCVVVGRGIPSCWSLAQIRFSSQQYDPSIKRTRNIGIIAHIDAVRWLLEFPC